jgi:surface protein
MPKFQVWQIANKQELIDTLYSMYDIKNNPARADVYYWPFGDIRFWDTSNVTDMSNLFNVVSFIYSSYSEDFKNFIQTFNQDISGWNVSAVTNMDSMFQGVRYFNQNISGWDVSRVTNMSRMFKYAILFDAVLSKWDVDKVIDCKHFSQVAPNLKFPPRFNNCTQ